MMNMDKINIRPQSNPVDFTTSLSFFDILLAQYQYQPDKVAFIHLVDGHSHEIQITYRELFLESLYLADKMLAHNPSGKRALLMLDPGFEYVISLLACFFVNSVAIPSHPPVGSRAMNRLSSIVSDAEPEIILVNNTNMNKYKAKVSTFLNRNKNQLWIDVDNSICYVEKSAITSDEDIALLCAKIKKFEDNRSNSIALLQYTSGSTSVPKGVMISHKNLMSNCIEQNIWMEGWKDRIGCSWLPPYHDMGLMGGILMPLYSSFTTIIMNPAHFIQNPYGWLDVMSRYKVTTTIAPNFALDLCVNDSENKNIEMLDLSSLNEFYCGAEPVRYKSFYRFIEHFNKANFKADSLCACYGLAEATLFVSGRKAGKASPKFVFANAKELAADNYVAEPISSSSSITIASCGSIAVHNDVIIVELENHCPLDDGKIGEIWMKGPSVGQGYWGKPERNKDDFHGTLNNGESNFLRTGDLGFLLDNELYITGRRKDLIIISGRNLYPQDIEYGVQDVSSNIQLNAVVALSIENDSQEAIAVIVGMRRGVKLTDQELKSLHDKINTKVTSVTGFSPAVIQFVSGISIPTTTSGKIQRQKTKQAWSNDLLKPFKSSKDI